MKTTHTAGPWRVDWLSDEDGWVLDDAGNYLATIVTSDEEGMLASPKQQQANALMMAAAPDLVAVARRTARYLAESERAGDQVLRVALEKVIAQAEGRR